MNKTFFSIILIALMLFAIPSGAFAGGKSRVAQFSFFNPIQVFPEQDSVRALRFNMLYGYNKDITGLDFGTVNRVSGNLSGVQLGVFNWVHGDGEVWQSAVVNITEGNFLGVQTGFFNWTKKSHTKGAQLGIVNIAGKLDSALQIGLLNFNNSGEPMKFLPIVNFSF